MQTEAIPQYVNSVIADTVSCYETHASLDSLFMHANATSDPPEGSEADKALEWLRRINKDCGANEVLAAAQQELDQFNVSGGLDLLQEQM
nr:hypothetical protein [Pseudomonas fluorescens]